MANLLQETLDALNVNTIDEAIMIIDWAKVYIDIDNGKVKQCIATPDGGRDEAREFFNSIDYDYDDHYVRRVVFGTIMLMNGVWLERSDYDGWTHHSMPEF